MARKTNARERLLAAARQSFADNGYQGLPARSIYKACRLSQGTFSHFFPKGLPQLRAEIFPAVHDAIWAEVLAGFQLPHRARPQTTIDRAHSKLAERFEQDLRRTRLYFTLVDGTGIPGIDDPVIGRLKEDRLVVAAWLESLAPGATLGPPANQGYAFLFGQLLEVSRLWSLGQIEEPPRALLPLLDTQAWFKNMRPIALGQKASMESSQARLFPKP